MMTALTRYLIIGLVLAAAAAVGILTYQKQGLEGDNALLTEKNTTAQATISTQETTITTLETSMADNAKAHQKLLAQIYTTKNLINKHEQTIATLENENADLKKWSVTPLPQPVSQLRQRPAITGSQGYRDWLSERDAMSITSHQPTNQR